MASVTALPLGPSYPPFPWNKTLISTKSKRNIQSTRGVRELGSLWGSSGLLCSGSVFATVMNMVSILMSWPLQTLWGRFLPSCADILSSYKSRETSTTDGSSVKPPMQPCWLPTSFKVMEGDSRKHLAPLSSLFYQAPEITRLINKVFTEEFYVTVW